MPELGFAELLASDPGPFSTAARAWKQLAEDLDNAAEDVIRSTRDLAEVWPEGDAAEAAEQRTATVRNEVCNAYLPARRIGEALQAHADAMYDLCGQAGDLYDEAMRSGFVIDWRTGVISVSAAAAGYRSPDSLERQVNEVAASMTELVGRARALDARTTNALVVNLPDATVGFGALARVPVSREEILAQQGKDPKAVNDWWNDLDPQQQEAALQQYPDLVGWLNGVPAEDRDAANRLRLQRDGDNLQHQADDLNRQLADLNAHPPVNHNSPEFYAWNAQRTALQDRLDDVHTEQQHLAKTKEALDKLGTNGYLLGLDPTGDGKAIISVGNPDTAKYTSVMVPGLGTTLDDAPGAINRQLNLYRSVDSQASGGQTATMWWLGYDAPEFDASVALSERSEQGGAALDPFVDGLRVTHDTGTQDRLVVIGHSYGSTVVAEADLHGNGLAADDVIVAGSPGLHTDNAANLHIDPHHLWVGAAPDDPVAYPGYYGDTVAVASAPLLGPLGWVLDEAYKHDHGPEPQDPAFGANQFHVNTHGHSDYWNANSGSIDNQAKIIVGDYSHVKLDHKAPTP
ncbi:alpha/beta hydrolase [Dactylosporangium sp. NPDC051485]|uniref:alpha/beta hydrolase n=1 Tax=Dactylosporangium sp. NPDC051485 TaxID=3154846 RepID=UPI00343E30B5